MSFGISCTNHKVLFIVCGVELRPKIKVIFPLVSWLNKFYSQITRTILSDFWITQLKMSAARNEDKTPGWASMGTSPIFLKLRVDNAVTLSRNSIVQLLGRKLFLELPSHIRSISQVKEYIAGTYGMVGNIQLFVGDSLLLPSMDANVLRKKEVIIRDCSTPFLSASLSESVSTAEELIDKSVAQNTLTTTRDNDDEIKSGVKTFGDDDIQLEGAPHDGKVEATPLNSMESVSELQNLEELMIAENSLVVNDVTQEEGINDTKLILEVAEDNNIMSQEILSTFAGESNESSEKVQEDNIGITKNALHLANKSGPVSTLMDMNSDAGNLKSTIEISTSTSGISEQVTSSPPTSESGGSEIDYVAPDNFDVDPCYDHMNFFDIGEYETQGEMVIVPVAGENMLEENSTSDADDSKISLDRTDDHASIDQTETTKDMGNQPQGQDELDVTIDNQNMRIESADVDIIADASEEILEGAPEGKEDGRMEANKAPKMDVVSSKSSSPEDVGNNHQEQVETLLPKSGGEVSSDLDEENLESSMPLSISGDSVQGCKPAVYDKRGELEMDSEIPVLELTSAKTNAKGKSDETINELYEPSSSPESSTSTTDSQESSNLDNSDEKLIRPGWEIVDTLHGNGIVPGSILEFQYSSVAKKSRRLSKFHPQLYKTTIRVKQVEMTSIFGYIIDQEGYEGEVDKVNPYYFTRADIFHPVYLKT